LTDNQPIIEDRPFEHVIVDLSLREVTTSKGDIVTICQIEANGLLDCKNAEERVWYSWGRVIEDGEPFKFEAGCFCFILIKNCCGDMGLFAIAHTIPEDPSFQALIYEGDKLYHGKCSDTSIDQKADFLFIWFNANQKVRIETIPDIETYWLVTGVMKERPQEEEEEKEDV
jgi:hypothetical protein